MSTLKPCLKRGAMSLPSKRIRKKIVIYLKQVNFFGPTFDFLITTCPKHSTCHATTGFPIIAPPDHLWHFSWSGWTIYCVIVGPPPPCHSWSPMPDHPRRYTWSGRHYHSWSPCHIANLDHSWHNYSPYNWI